MAQAHDVTEFMHEDGHEIDLPSSQAFRVS